MATEATTTQKHRTFAGEAMGEKPVSKLAGVGDVLGKKLEEAGFDKAHTVFGQFLVLKKDKKAFQDWMKKTCNADSRRSGECYECLKDWCDRFMK